MREPVAVKHIGASISPLRANSHTRNAKVWWPVDHPCRASSAKQTPTHRFGLLLIALIGAVASAIDERRRCYGNVVSHLGCSFPHHRCCRAAIVAAHVLPATPMVSLSAEPGKVTKSARCAEWGWDHGFAGGLRRIPLCISSPRYDRPHLQFLPEAGRTDTRGSFECQITPIFGSLRQPDDEHRPKPTALGVGRIGQRDRSDRQFHPGLQLPLSAVCLRLTSEHHHSHWLSVLHQGKGQAHQQVREMNDAFSLNWGLRLQRSVRKPTDVTAETAAAAGRVKNQAVTIDPATPQRTEKRFVHPTPAIDVETTCVVE